MGSVTFYTDRTFAEEVCQALTGSYTGQGERWQVVDRAGRYYAVRYPDGRVEAVVALGSKTRDGQVSIKLVSENEGPLEKSCPARILDKLTEAPNEYARDWRAACRANLTRPTLKPGDTIELSRPVEFTNGESHTRFKFDKAYTFQVVRDDGSFGYRVRLPKTWKSSYGWRIV
jgi:hypothetical protein